MANRYISYIVVFLAAAALFRCATKQESPTAQLSQEQRNEMLALSDKVLGEVQILSETELNPLFIEYSVKEIGQYSPLVRENNERLDTLDEELDLKLDEETGDFTDLLTTYVSESDIKKLKKVEKYIKGGGKIIRKYGDLLAYAAKPEVLRECFSKGKLELELSGQCSLINLNSCKLTFHECDIEGYLVSGTVYVTVLGTVNYVSSISIEFDNLKFERKGERDKKGKEEKDKYVSFVTGIIEITFGGIGIHRYPSAITVSKVKIVDTEVDIVLEGNITHTITRDDNGFLYSTSLSDVKLRVEDGTEYSINGKVDAKSRGKGNIDLSFKIEVSSDELEGKLNITGSHIRTKSKQPKSFFDELSIDLSFTSQATSFSASAYRYRSVNQKDEGERTFSISITAYFNLNGETVRAYVCDLIVSVDRQIVKISGDVKVTISEGEEIHMRFEDVELERSCLGRPTGGKVVGTYRIHKVDTAKFVITFSPECACDANVEVEIGDKSVKGTRNICEAGKNAKDKLKAKRGEILKGKKKAPELSS